MKEKTRRRVNLAILWILILVFAASGILLYLPMSQGGGPSATPAPPGAQNPL